jgi:2-oxoglutarate ferredoxin oxidoreductase subunit gamma
MFFAGSGGQGILLMGQMVSLAAMYEDKSTTFFPSYGPEMRGGTANCTVVVSEKTVGCPIIFESDIVIAMNLPSMLKFEPTLKPGGTMFLNKSIIHQAPKRDDITIYEIPANDIAIELGNPRVANMVMLGAFTRKTGVIGTSTIERCIHEIFGARSEKLSELNIKAFNHLQ